MNVKEKIGFLECSNNYNKYLLECIKDHFATENLYKKWSIKCDGTGQCFTNVPGTNIFYRYKGCKHDCKVEKCPNFTLCKNYVPKFMLDEYYDLCYECSIAYKPCGKGKGVLKVFKEKECEKCKRNTECIEQAFCDHILCMDCFKIAHYKPGNDECPLCNISARKIMEM